MNFLEQSIPKCQAGLGFTSEFEKRVWNGRYDAVVGPVPHEEIGPDMWLVVKLPFCRMIALVLAPTDTVVFEDANALADDDRF